MPTDKPRFSIQLEEDEAAKLRMLAKADGRPIANFVKHLILKHLNEEQADNSAKKKTLGTTIRGKDEIRNPKGQKPGDQQATG